MEDTAQCLTYIVSLLLSGSRRNIGWIKVKRKLHFRELTGGWKVNCKIPAKL